MGLSITANAFFQAPSAGEAASFLPNYNLLDPESAALLGANLILLQEVGGLSDAAYFSDQIGEGHFSSLNPDQRKKFLGTLAHFLKTIPPEIWKRLQWLSGSGELGARRHLQISTRRFSDDPRTVLKNSLVDRVAQRLGVDGAVFASAGDSSAAIRQSDDRDEESLTEPDIPHLIRGARAKARREKYDLAAEMMVQAGLEIQKAGNGTTPENCFREAADYYGQAAEKASQWDSPAAAVRILRKMAAGYLANGQWFDAEEAFFRSQKSRLEAGLNAAERVTAEKMTVLMRAKATAETQRNDRFVAKELEDVLREMERLNVEIEWALPPQLRFARAHASGSFYSKRNYPEAVAYYRNAFQERLEIMEPVFVRMVLELLGNALGMAFLRRFYSEQTLQATLDFLESQPQFPADVKQQVEQVWKQKETIPPSFQEALSAADKAMDAGLTMGEQSFSIVTFYDDALHTQHSVTPTDLFLQATRYFRMARQYQSITPEARNTPLHIPLKGAVAYMFAGDLEKAFSILGRYTEQNPVIKRVMGAMVAEIAPKTFGREFALAWNLLGTYEDDARLTPEIRARNRSEFSTAREEAVKAQRLSDTGNLPGAEEKFTAAVSRMRRIADPQFAAQLMDLLGDRMGQAFLKFFYEEEAYREVWKIVAPWVRHSDDEVQPLPPASPVATQPPRPFVIAPLSFPPPPGQIWKTMQLLLPPLPPPPPQRQPTLRELVDSALAKKELTDDTLKAMATRMGRYDGQPVDPEMLRQHIVAYGDLFVSLAHQAGFQPYHRFDLHNRIQHLAKRHPLEKPKKT